MCVCVCMWVCELKASYGSAWREECCSFQSSMTSSGSEEIPGTIPSCCHGNQIKSHLCSMRTIIARMCFCIVHVFAIVGVSAVDTCVTALIL